MDDEDQHWPEPIREWVLPYVRNQALWPVLVALLGHVVIVLCPLMLAVWRVGSDLAGFGLVVVAGVTVAACVVEVRGLRRPGAVCLALGSTWAVAVGLSMFAERTGLL